MPQDYYITLSNLDLNSPFTLPQEASSYGVIPYRDQTVSVFTLPSSIPSNPHIIYLLNETQQLAFLQLTLPASESKQILEELNQSKNLYTLLYLPKTRAEQMYAFPENGIAYIVNDYTGQVLRIQKFLPETAEQFQANEGKNFTPQTLNPDPISLTPTTVASQSSIYHWQSEYSLPIRVSIPLIVLIISITLIRIIRKKHQS